MNPNQNDSTNIDANPRHLNLSQNVMLTIKLVVIFAIVGAALWGLDTWTSAR